MGTLPTTSVDPAGLRAAAQRLDTAADILLGAVLGEVSALQFDGTVAGRGHAAAGVALRAKLERLSGDVCRWAQAAQELATALRAGAARHSTADEHAAVTLR